MNAQTKINPPGLTEWLASGKTGASSLSIVARLTGQGKQTGCYPADESDFNRCEYLLEMVPDLLPNLNMMVDVNAYWAALIPQWEEIKRSGNKSDLIASIVHPIEAADPAHIKISEGVSIRIGVIDFGIAADPIAEGADHARAEVEKAARKGRPPMKSDPDFAVHNDQAYNVTADELRQFIERAERLAAEKKDIAEQEKELFAEAKGRGYDTKVMRKIIALRKRSADEVAEEDAILELYKSALGMN